MVDFAGLPTDLAMYERYVGDLSFPYLTSNSAESCPRGEKEVVKYAGVEAEIKRRNLRFVRTANVDDVHFWVWEDVSASDHKNFVSIELYGGSVMLGCQWAGTWLTAEKYMAWRYAKGWR